MSMFAALGDSITDEKSIGSLLAVHSPADEPATWEIAHQAEMQEVASA
jgi:hypothetical protein